MRRALSVTVGAALIAAVPVTASAAPAAGPDAEAAPQRVDDLPSPLSDKQRALRQAAVEKVVRGEATPRGDNEVVQVAKGQYVELAQDDSDAIWTVLGEFSDLPHNRIPEPDRDVDNTTIWTEDFSQPYFDELLYSSAAGVNSVANYYEEQSSGRYTVTGEVEDWVTVPGTGASYGSNDKPDSATWDFVDDSVDAWYARQLGSGRSAAEIDRYLSRFDVWDRYDHDADGDFDEADGYIDHFQAVHSGQGEEVGGGTLGADAIWSHRWYVNYTDIGSTGPTLGDAEVLQGGTRIGGSRYWIGDYTVEPENGGVGVFAHEFGHDLGLPDLYDTRGGENGTGFWTLMSSGSYGNSGRPADGIGTAPVHMGAWEKIQLGWLDPEVVEAGERGSVKVGPSTTTTKQAQALLAVLPDQEVTTTIGESLDGGSFWYSGQGDDLDHTMLAAEPSGTTLTAKVQYDIEQDYDYAYVGYLRDGRFVTLPTALSSEGANNGITGSSGGEWVDLTVDVSDVPAGARFGFRYRTDGGWIERGLLVDDVAVDGVPVENWELDGFTETTGTVVDSHFNAYIAEYRQYRGYDSALRTGPYNFGDPVNGDWAERFPYQDGLLISYWNTRYADNNVSVHPGAGLVLPVDARPALLRQPDGGIWRPRIQTHDATFGLERTDAITLHDAGDGGAAGGYGGLPAVSTFDDTRDWYVARGEVPGANGQHGVDVPKTGTTIRVVGVSAQGGFMQVQVN